MNLTVSELLQTALATPVMLLLLLPPGFAVGWAANVMAFRTRSAIEQLVWSVSLSVPVSLVLANIAGRVLGPTPTLLCFLLLDVLSLVLMLRRIAQRDRRTLGLDRYASLVLLALAAEVLYLWFAGMPVRLGHRLYEPVFSSDWEIRLPSILAAVRDAVPPHNPFFTLHGQSPPMRYYYFWYSVCAQVVRLVHTDSRSSLLASSVYAALALIATLFLYLKYMTHSETPLRRRCLLLLGLLCVLSLDVLPSLAGLFLWRTHLRPEIEWWSSDRSPGLPAAVLYSPHHVAGAACGLSAFLLLSLLTTLPQPVPWRTVFTHALLAALAFAGLTGNSSFLLLFFGLACVLLFADRLLRKDLRTPAALAVTGLVALTLAAPWLHEFLAVKAQIAVPAGGHRALAFQFRDNRSAQFIITRCAALLHKPEPRGPGRFVLRGAVIALLLLCETGFFFIILLLQFRLDFLRRRPMAADARALWMLALATGFFALFVTSAPIQFVNDLGVHAGLLLRVIFTLWSVQTVSWYLAERRLGRSWLPAQTALIRLAAVLLLLGVLTFLWQATIERLYLVLVDRRVLPVSKPFPQGAHLAAIYNNIYDAEHTLAQLLPPTAVLQSNPAGRYQTVFRLYQQGRQAAGDTTCEGAFGGDPQLCRSFALNLLRLFGSHASFPAEFAHLRPDPQNMTLAAMTSVCRQTGIAALLVTPADPAWSFPQSWVWQGPLLFRNTDVRAIACPSSPSSPQHPHL